jgi:formate hydrogenlyase subunit 4
MVHEAMILEYSGKRLALMEWAAANKLLIFIALGANLFFPWGIGSDFGFFTIIVSLGIFALKAFGFPLYRSLESTIAKFRIFRVLIFSLSLVLMIALGIIITI